VNAGFASVICTEKSINKDEILIAKTAKITLNSITSKIKLEFFKTCCAIMKLLHPLITKPKASGWRSCTTW
jgi:hypothetical protein